MISIHLKYCKENGGEKSYKDLYLNSYQFLYNIALRYVLHDAAAKDVLQETYIKIYKSLPSFTYKDENSSYAWLKRICINESIGYLRKKKNWDKLQVTAVSQIHHDSNTPIFNDELQNVLNELPELQRLVFILFAIEDYKHKEIAEKLSIKESHSRTMLTRARKYLSTRLTKKAINETI